MGFYNIEKCVIMLNNYERNLRGVTVASILYVCPVCMGFCKATEHGKQIKCPKCRNIQLIEAGLSGDEWMGMSSGERRNYLDGLNPVSDAADDTVDIVSEDIAVESASVDIAAAENAVIESIANEGTVK